MVKIGDPRGPMRGLLYACQDCLVGKLDLAHLPRHIVCLSHLTLVLTIRHLIIRDFVKLALAL